MTSLSTLYALVFDDVDVDEEDLREHTNLVFITKQFPTHLLRKRTGHRWQH